MNVRSRVDNEQVIPVIQSSVFDGHPGASFAVAIVRDGGQVREGFSAESEGYGRLRGNVYALQQGYMPEEELNPDGTEDDADDLRSVHFVVLQRREEIVRVVGGQRFIVKAGVDDEPLPVEKHFPDAFSEPAPANSTETSRLIARNGDPAFHILTKWLLLSAGLTYALERNLGPMYGAVEYGFARRLQADGVPVVQLGEARHVPEFNARKMPIEIMLADMRRNMLSKRHGILELAGPAALGQVAYIGAESSDSAPSRRAS